MATLLYNVVFWIVFLFTIHKIYYEGDAAQSLLNFLNFYKNVFAIFFSIKIRTASVPEHTREHVALVLSAPPPICSCFRQNRARCALMPPAAALCSRFVLRSYCSLCMTLSLTRITLLCSLLDRSKYYKNTHLDTHIQSTV